MSLSVDVFVIGEDGGRHVLDTPEGANDLAGFESWRTRVWGSDAVRALGAWFFPVLADSDLWIAPGQVPDFRRECALLRANLERIASQPYPQKTYEWYLDTLSVRLGFIEDAAERAAEVGGGVVIW
ncbi:hypothetical protein [Streptomyces sp. BA2]|uniref:hypothetical protein n=1 Tax=Streptomyces sp. BA2 TaxID=436595 RepID=UPI0013206427|nr:hypothetical protein [Streptomyces sp. BA2]MWA12454.1 hypothetical protein [Streptomyces sp. BA2]